MMTNRKKAKIAVFALLLCAAASLAIYSFLTGRLEKPTSPVVPTETETEYATPKVEDNTLSMALASPENDDAADEDSRYTKALLERAEQLMAGMSDTEKICQMFIVQPESLTGVSLATVAGESTRLALEKYPVGGLIYLSKNLLHSEQVREMIANSQSYSKTGLFITADEEGGRVSRLTKSLGTTPFMAMFSYRNDGAETAYNNAATIAADMLSYGFNLDLAPVADVWSNPANTVIGDRAYSDSFEDAAVLVESAVKGFRDSGLACVLKHFPGHGNTKEDTHYKSAYVYKLEEELKSEELLPFISGINAGADMVMVGHMIISDIDNVPSTISSKVITGLLREELGYNGVVITDGLEMGAMSGYGSAQTSVMAVEAGADILLAPKDLAESVQAIADAVDEGRLSMARIEESVLRILLVKIERGIIN